MRTIGRRLPAGSRGDRTETCDICGVKWLRSKLRRDGSGRLACPDDFDHNDEVTLDRENAALAAEEPRALRFED
jgi:hypothetical protein